MDFQVPAQDGQHFWDDDVPLILEQAIEVLKSRGNPQEFDTLVIDEAQDFAPDWWITVESLIRGGESGRLYVFMDLHQSVRGQAQLPPISLPARFNLTTNCRNTQAIAKTAAALVGATITLLPGSPEGEPPGIRRAPSEAAEGGIALSEIRRLLQQGVDPRQIALIGPTTHDRGLLRTHPNVDGIPLIDDAAEWRRGGGILVTTARAFKGLEADVVLIYDVGGFGTMFTLTDLYVAWTRARHRLVIMCRNAEVRAVVENVLGQFASRPADI